MAIQKTSLQGSGLAHTVSLRTSYYRMQQRGAGMGTDSKAIWTRHDDRGWEDAPGHAPDFRLVKAAGGGCRSGRDLRLTLLLSSSKGLSPRLLLGCHCHANAFATLVDALRKGTRSLAPVTCAAILENCARQNIAGVRAMKRVQIYHPFHEDSRLSRSLYRRLVLRPTGSAQQRLPAGPSKRLRCRYSRPLNDRQKSIGRMARELQLGLPFLGMNAPRATHIADAHADSKSKRNRNEQNGW